MRRLLPSPPPQPSSGDDTSPAKRPCLVLRWYAWALPYRCRQHYTTRLGPGSVNLMDRPEVSGSRGKPNRVGISGTQFFGNYTKLHDYTLSEVHTTSRIIVHRDGSKLHPNTYSPRRGANKDERQTVRGKSKWSSELDLFHKLRSVSKLPHRSGIVSAPSREASLALVGPLVQGRGLRGRVAGVGLG